MSTRTIWIADKEIPEVVAFVNSASDTVRARFVEQRTCKMEHDGEIIATAMRLAVWFCSECGSPTYNDMMPFYCQYCGARVERNDDERNR